ncbi:hypothetical protein HKD37_07G020176 [Glycine soja]
MHVKNMIFRSSFLQMATQTLTPSSPPPTTTSGHHKPSFLAVRPPHKKEYFNRSRIFKIHLKDSVENRVPNPFFHGFFENSAFGMTDVNVRHLQAT